MAWVEIYYDHQDFFAAKTAIVQVGEKEEFTYINDYFRSATEKLLTYLFENYAIDIDDVIIHDCKYHGNLIDILK